MIQEENLMLCWPGDLQCEAFVVGPALSQAGFRAGSRQGAKVRWEGDVTGLLQGLAHRWHPVSVYRVTEVICPYNRGLGTEAGCHGFMPPWVTAGTGSYRAVPGPPTVGAPRRPPPVHT